MEYLAPVTATQQPAQHGAGKYVGQIAATYDKRREDTEKWRIEQMVLESWLSEIPEGSTILDAPLGTGRFLETYARRKFVVYGLDRSPDMLNEAAKKVPAGFSIKIGQGNVLACGLPDKSVDASLNIRITRWLSPDECKALMREMQRVARHKIIWTARVDNHPHARSLDLFESALDGWRITRNEAGVDLAYRILMAEPC